MTFLASSIRKLAIPAFLASLTFSSAQAADANAVAERLKEVMAGQGMDIAWTSVSGSGDEVVLEGTTLKVAGAEETVPIGAVTLAGVTDKGGGYRVDKVTLPAYAMSEGDIAVDVAGAEIKGLTLPAPGATDPLASIMLYEAADLSAVSLKQAGKPLFSLSNLHVDITPPANGSALTFQAAAEKLSADLSSVGDPQAKKVIQALGYETLNGTVKMAGSWQPTDGRLGLTQYDISIDDAGTLGLGFDLGGYTPDFIKALQDIQKKMAAQPEGADNSAQGLAMLGLMQQLTFHSAKIRFDDASLTGKILAYIAGQQGAQPADIVNQAKALLPFALAQLNDPELSKQVTEAVGSFLDEPKSLEIRAAPPSPLPFAVVAAGAMAAPKDLPKTLGVTVTANQ